VRAADRAPSPPAASVGESRCTLCRARDRIRGLSLLTWPREAVRGQGHVCLGSVQEQLRCCRSSRRDAVIVAQHFSAGTRGPISYVRSFLLLSPVQGRLKRMPAELLIRRPLRTRFKWQVYYPDATGKRGRHPRWGSGPSRFRMVSASLRAEVLHEDQQVDDIYIPVAVEVRRDHVVHIAHQAAEGIHEPQ
jgi:hypothetical protein